MTYRERREARAARLREWADNRMEEVKAHYTAREADPLTHDWAFITQPGRIPERDRRRAQDTRVNESHIKANKMDSRAASIESQLDRSIYSDDPDADERLGERIAELASKLAAMKAKNAAFRKSHVPELRAMTPYGRSQAIPHPRFEITNLSANIRRLEGRRVTVQQAALGNEHPRYLVLRFSGKCRDCGRELATGSNARYYKLAQEIACYPACT